jgi:ABC-type phosphate transport system auxiliary subunit
MTKKLEETFNINPIDDEEEIEETPTVEESRELTEILNAEIETTDKIDAALPMVSDLNQHDREMDEIHSKALHAFEELFSLGMNVEVHAGAKLMETANQMLKTAMEAKDSKVDRKLRMINLQMQKARLEHQIEKEEKKNAKDDDDFETEGKVVMDRNELMKRLAQAQSKIDDSDK